MPPLRTNRSGLNCSSKNSRTVARRSVHSSMDRASSFNVRTEAHCSNEQSNCGCTMRPYSVPASSTPCLSQADPIPVPNVRHRMSSVSHPFVSRAIANAAASASLMIATEASTIWLNRFANSCPSHSLPIFGASTIRFPLMSPGNPIPIGPT
ncbi:MAG: Uncharacterised protein [Candidatus Poseidoniaceae archaeon]|nr:MAG: Uncharacterised protein [Candidatus Poseidoniaceae archaeon]